MTAPNNKETTLFVWSSFDYINSWYVFCSCLAEMGSSALLTVVLAGVLLSISAIHAGE